MKDLCLVWSLICPLIWEKTGIRTALGLEGSEPIRDSNGLVTQIYSSTCACALLICPTNLEKSGLGLQ
jgi:hypothetical protein